MSNIEQELKQLNDFMTDHKVLYASDSTKNRRMWINLRGKFFVTKGMEEGRVWIGRESGDLAGEGGDFDQDALSALIEKFYEERF